jgi:hypothetical protein
MIPPTKQPSALVRQSFAAARILAAPRNNSGGRANRRLSGTIPQCNSPLLPTTFFVESIDGR